MAAVACNSYKISTWISTSVEATNDIWVRVKQPRTPYNLRCIFIFEALDIKANSGWRCLVRHIQLTLDGFSLTAGVIAGSHPNARNSLEPIILVPLEDRRIPILKPS